MSPRRMLRTMMLRGWCRRRRFTGAMGSPRPGEDRWTYIPPAPAVGQPIPSFATAPAVAQVPLTGFPTQNDVSAKIVQKNREWLVVTADGAGNVIALEAFGKASST